MVAYLKQQNLPLILYCKNVGFITWRVSDCEELTEVIVLNPLPEESPLTFYY